MTRWSTFKTVATLPDDRRIHVRHHGIAANVVLDRDYYVDRLHDAADLPADVVAAVDRCADTGTLRLWVNGYTQDFMYGAGPRFVTLWVPRDHVDRAVAALTAADIASDPTLLDQLAEQMRPPFHVWLAPGARTLRRGVDFTCPPNHMLTVLRGRSHRWLRLNGRADRASVHVDPRLKRTAALIVEAFGQETAARQLGVAADLLALFTERPTP